MYMYNVYLGDVQLYMYTCKVLGACRESGDIPSKEVRLHMYNDLWFKGCTTAN